MADESAPSIKVPMAQWLVDFAERAGERAARTVIAEHIETCPIREVQARVDELRMRFSLLIGALLGSGVLGGAVGAAIVKAVM